MPLTDAEKKDLLEIARRAIEAAARGRSPGAPRPEGQNLNQDSGAFVSIHKNGRLRGCIGTFASPNPLYKTVEDMAVSAASKDPRFSPVGADELDSIDIEISVLTPLREIKDASEIEVGRHGIYIIKGRDRGVLLPQVAVEHSFDRETFLDQTCLKAGLDPGDWKNGASIFVFEAEIFRERQVV